MNNQSETLTGGIHHILFGVYKPSRVLERYEQQQADNDLCHLLNTFPLSPESYTDLHENIRVRWEVLINSYKDLFCEWLPSFYALPEKESTAFHILCDFYGSFVRAECRMLIQVSEAWKEDLAITTLKYELLTLRNELLDLIRETALRLKRYYPGTLIGRLDRFVLMQLQNSLLTTFLELQIRSAHLLEDNVIPKRELFLKYLKQPELKKISWHRTSTLTRFELEGALRTPEKPDQLRSVENLLKKIRNESFDHETEIRDSINLLENVWFCLFIMNVSDIWNGTELNDPEECSKNIDELHQQFYQISADDDRANTEEIVQIVIHSFDMIQSVLKTETTGKSSSAGRLIRSIKSYYESTSEDHFGSSESKMIREAPASSILEQFIPVDQLQEKLNVTHKSMKHYLSESNTPVHKFSNKTRLIHVNDFNAMMNHFKTTL